MSNLSPTARVILGFLRLGARTGYEIKSAVEQSTRFFWGASFGQIYPELKRLEEHGLVEAQDDPRGGVRRRAYSLTPSGEQALHGWLTTGDGFLFEYRDEALLKLFFGDLLSREEVLENVRAARAQFEAIAAFFRREIHPSGRYEFPPLALRYGIDLIDWIAGWWAERERELADL